MTKPKNPAALVASPLCPPVVDLVTKAVAVPRDPQ